MRFSALVVSLVLAPLSLRADALTDLRTTLTQLGATTPAHGTFEVTSTSTSSDEGQAFQGKASVGFDISDAGLRIVYPKATLVQANQEARAEAVDPDRQTPVRSGMGRIRALELADLLDAAAMLNVELQDAQLIEAKPTTYHGSPARLIALKLLPKLSKGTAKRLKKLDASLSIWLADDGLPVAAERAVLLKMSFMLISFESDQKESWTYTRAGDRLVATRHQETQKSDGFGQHNSSQVAQVVRLEP
ncbi:MAG TPA: hypothetical protein VKL19_01375 [Thermoanaerobaculia bacterium]|nr:hypothetical protein [Thermoanaerobaculia bacterium]